MPSIYYDEHYRWVSNIEYRANIELKSEWILFRRLHRVAWMRTHSMVHHRLSGCEVPDSSLVALPGAATGSPTWP